MVATQERTALIAGKQGKKDFQGIFPGADFDHLDKRVVEMESLPSGRELMLWGIRNTFLSMTASANEWEEGKKPDEGRFFNAMDMAFMSAQTSCSKGDVHIIPIDGIENEEQELLLSILSNGESGAVRVELRDEGTKIVVDIKRDSISIHATTKEKKSKFDSEPPSILSAFFPYDDFNNDETQMTEEDLLTIRALDRAIFRKNREGVRQE